MTDEQQAAVLRYLQIHFPGRTVEQKHDFDREAQGFKVVLDRDTLLLKITDTFFDDHQSGDMLELLDRFEAGEALERTRGSKNGVMVTADGLRMFDRG